MHRFPLVYVPSATVLIVRTGIPYRPYTINNIIIPYLVDFTRYRISYRTYLVTGTRYCFANY